MGMGRLWLRRSRGVLVGFCAVLAVAGNSAARPASLKWEQGGGPFETCLQTRMDQWISAQAERIANDDPAAGDIDDSDVALWAASTIEGCTRQAGPANRNSEVQFARHMAHWREHIDTVAQDIRQRGRAD